MLEIFLSYWTNRALINKVLSDFSSLGGQETKVQSSFTIIIFYTISNKSIGRVYRLTMRFYWIFKISYWDPNAGKILFTKYKCLLIKHQIFQMKIYICQWSIVVIKNTCTKNNLSKDLSGILVIDGQILSWWVLHDIEAEERKWMSTFSAA